MKTEKRARTLLSRLKTLEEWSTDKEVMEQVQRLFGQPRAFYERFKETLQYLAKEKSGTASSKEVK